jgi:hypothetical protein
MVHIHKALLYVVKTNKKQKETPLNCTNSGGVLDVRSFRAVDCDIGHYLVLAKIRERLAVSKQTTCRFHMERFSLKILNKV